MKKFILIVPNEGENDYKCGLDDLWFEEPYAAVDWALATFCAAEPGTGLYEQAKAQFLQTGAFISTAKDYSYGHAIRLVQPCVLPPEVEPVKKRRLD